MFKFAFIVFSVMRHDYALIIGLLASAFGLVRMLKMPQLNKNYLQKALTNSHGQNIFYIGMGFLGYTNFLFTAPLMLYFAYSLVEFYNQMFPLAVNSPPSTLQSFISTIRNNRFYIMEGKSRL
jgi:hypothetical protein